MLKLSMVEEVEEYKVSCADCIAEADTSENPQSSSSRLYASPMSITIRPLNLPEIE